MHRLQSSVAYLLHDKMLRLGSKVVDWHIHRWLYAFAKNPLTTVFYREANMQLTIAGDAFISSRVESAALSGISAAEALIQSLK